MKNQDEIRDDPWANFLEAFRYRPPTPWAKDAACRGLDPALFFPMKGGEPVVQEAKKVCDGCPVLEECRAYGVKYERFGIWGGMTAEELQRARNARPVPFAA
jgi:WhiB family redox-sensing transcriptional regulator